MSGWIICAIVVALAAANGANDNIKGAATLVGSGLMGYRGAIRYATLATAAGGLLSIWLAGGLLSAFSGKGLVPQELITSAEFPLTVAAAAGHFRDRCLLTLREAAGTQDDARLQVLSKQVEQAYSEFLANIRAAFEADS